MTTEKQELRMLAHVSKSRYDSTHYEVEVRPVRMEDGHVRNIPELWRWQGRYDNVRPEEYADLVISARGGVGDINPPYGWHVEYHEPFRVDVERAEHMAKTLKRINRSLARMEEREGAPESFAMYVIRVARAIGVDTFGYVTQRGNGWSHDTNEHRWMNGRDFQWWMTQEIAKLQTEGRDDQS